MSVKRITIVLIALGVIAGFIYLGVQDAVKTKDNLEFQKVQLKSRQTEIKELNMKYERLNQDLNKASEQKETDKAEVERLQKEKNELEQQKLDLERQLQAKLEQKSKLAQASERAINAATMTQTASASSAPSGGSVESIVRRAAIRHGLNPDWFVQLAMCESTMNPNAVNYNYYENGHPSGLFQHISGYWPSRAAQYGYAGASVFDAEANANVTAAMWVGGSHLWECQ